MERDEIKRLLKAFVATEILQGDDKGLDGATSLLELGVIDSLTMIKVVNYIESHFKLKVPDLEVNPKNFKHLDAMADLVVRLATK